MTLALDIRKKTRNEIVNDRKARIEQWLAKHILKRMFSVDQEFSSRFSKRVFVDIFVNDIQFRYDESGTIVENIEVWLKRFKDDPASIKRFCDKVLGFTGADNVKDKARLGELLYTSVCEAIPELLSEKEQRVVVEFKDHR